MKIVRLLIETIFSLSLFAGALCRVDLFSLIYFVLVLITPWALIRSSFKRSKIFFFMAAIGFICSIISLMFIAAFHLFSLTTVGKKLVQTDCSMKILFLEHFGFRLWTKSTNKIRFVFSILFDLIIASTTKFQRSFLNFIEIRWF